MAKKFICVVFLVVSLICTFTSCGDSNNNTTNNPENPTHTHSYGEWIPLQAATCTTNGTKAKYCSCGDKITETIESTGHSYSDWNVTQAATCTTNGTKAKYCSCGDKITETIQSKGHDWVEATCTENKHCSNCNYSYSGTATGHIIQHGACVYCEMPGASIEWGHGQPKWVEYYYLWSDGDYDWEGGGYLYPDYGSDGAVFSRDGKLYFFVDGERNGTLFFDYQITDSYGRVVEAGTISAGNVRQGQTYMIDKYIGSLNPGEYILTVSSKNALD